MIKSPVSLYSAAFIALSFALLSGCGQAQNADQPIQTVAPRPEFTPNVTPDDLPRLKQDYQSAPNNRAVDMPPAAKPSPSAQPLPVNPPRQPMINPDDPSGPNPTPVPIKIDPPLTQPPASEPPAGEPPPDPTDPPPSNEPPPTAPPDLPAQPPASSDPTVPEPPPVTAPEPGEPPRYVSKPSFNIVRVRLFPIYKRDTPTQDPFVPNFAEKKLTLTNDQGLKLINIATQKVIATGNKVRFDIALNAILVDDKKVSVLIKSEVVPNVLGSGTTLNGLKEAAHKTDGYFKFDGSFTFMKTTVTNQAGSAVNTWHLVNFVYLEDYITAVTPSEVPQKWSDPAENATEAVKAQAVAARSYGLNTIITSRKATTREWDVVPTTANQFYSGIRFLNETSRALVRATAGQILVHNNEVILAVFSANSGGYTCSSKDCWGLNLPYLQAVEDAPEARDLPGGSREVVVSRLAFQRVLKANKIIVNVASKAESISILKMNDSHRVTQITTKVAGKTFNLNAAQTNNVLNQTSGSRRLMEFDELKNDKFTIRTFGFGHAIGMSQWGAYAFARKGMTYQQILSLYYQNTQLISLADK